MTIEKQCTEPDVGVKFAYDNSVECVGVNCVQVMGIAALAWARIHSTSTSTSEKCYIEQQSKVNRQHTFKTRKAHMSSSKMHVKQKSKFETYQSRSKSI